MEYYKTPNAQITDDVVPLSTDMEGNHGIPLLFLLHTLTHTTNLEIDLDMVQAQNLQCFPTHYFPLMPTLNKNEDSVVRRVFNFPNGALIPEFVTIH